MAWPRGVRRKRAREASFPQRVLSVEWECGAVALGRACLFAAPFVWRCLSGSGVARSHTPLIEPDKQFFCIRLSDET